MFLSTYIWFKKRLLRPQPVDFTMLTRKTSLTYSTKKKNEKDAHLKFYSTFNQLFPHELLIKNRNAETALQRSKNGKTHIAIVKWPKHHITITVL